MIPPSDLHRAAVANGHGPRRRFGQRRFLGRRRWRQWRRRGWRAQETAASSSNSGSLASASDVQQIALGGSVDKTTEKRLTLKNNHTLSPESVDEALEHDMRSSRGDTGSNHGPASGSPGTTSETGDKASVRGHWPAGGSSGKTSNTGGKTGKDNGSGRAFVSSSAVAGEHGIG